MLDKLGIAAFFPDLAEASKSALESNQYCQTRIENIIAKVRGAMIIPADDKIDINQEPEPAQLNPETPQLNALKNRLTQNQQEVTVASDTGSSITMDTSYKSQGGNSGTRFTIFSCGCNASYDECRENKNIIVRLMQNVVLK